MEEFSKLPDNWAERPDDFLGGSGSNYLQSPRRKMRASWIGGAQDNDDKGEGSKPSACTDVQGVIHPPGVFADGDNMSAAEPKSVNSMVMQSLAALSEQNDSKQEVAKVKLSEASHADSKASIDTTASANSTIEESHQSPDAHKKEVVSLQRKDILHMAERPGDWLGGEGEAAQTSNYVQCPKTKMRATWLKNNSEESQSLRDLTTGNPEPKHNVDKLHASESHLTISSPITGRRTSALVMQKLSEFSQKNEENHNRSEELAVQRKSQGLNNKSDTADASRPPKPPSAAEKNDIPLKYGDGNQVTPTRTAKEKIHFQREDVSHLVSRPDTWIGGEGEAAQPYTYLHSPHSKLRSSWLKDGSQSMSDVLLGTNVGSDGVGEDSDNLHSSDSQLFKKRQHQPSPMIKEKLAQLCMKNEENHKKNEELAAEKRPSAHRQPRVTSDLSTDISKTTEKPREADATPVTQTKTSHEKIALQRHDFDGHLTERPESWLGGEGEAAQPYTYLRSPKTKLKSSWLQKEADASQSLRDVTGSSDTGKNTDEDDLHASDPQLFSAHRRMTSPMIMQKLSEFNRKNEENHKKNEELATEKLHPGPSAPRMKAKDAATGTSAELKETGPLSPISAAKEKARLQRQDHNNAAMRPDDWLGGEPPCYSPTRSPGKKVKSRFLATSEKEKPVLTDFSQDSPKREADKVPTSAKEEAGDQPKEEREKDDDKVSKQESEGIGFLTPIRAAKETVRIQSEDHAFLATRPAIFLGGDESQYMQP